MNILDNIRKSIPEIRNQIESESKDAGGDLQSAMEGFYSQTATPKRKSSEYLKSAHGWVYGCVGVIADECASIELKLVQSKNGEETEVEDHEALDVIYKANNAMTRFDLVQTTFQYLELTGEAPWFVSFDKKAKPQGIILLRPDRLTVIPGKDGEMIGGYKYRVYSDTGIQDITLEPYEVVPLKYVDPDQPLRGKGPLQAACTTVDLDEYAERWNSQFFRNSATPNAAFQTDKVLAKDVRKRLEAKIKQNYQSVDNAHKTMILEGGLKFEKLSLSQKDMDFIQQQQFSRDKILAIFRVPRTALGITDDVNRANAEATDYVFAKRTIRPKMVRFTEQLNEFFLPLFGVNTDAMFFDFENPVPENVDQNIKRAESGVQSGYMTLNEARKIMGLDPIDGGDTLRDPATFAPAVGPNGLAMLGKEKSKKLSSRYQKHMVNRRTRGKKEAARKRKVIEETITESVIPIVFNYLKTKSGRSKFVKNFIFNNGTPEQIKESKWGFQEKQLNVATQFEAKFIKRMDAMFNVQKEIILRGLDGGDKMKLNVSTETERMMKYLRPTMIEMMREQARLAFQIVGVQRSLDSATKAGQTFLQRITEYFEVRAFRFSTEVSKVTNEKLQDQFKEGVGAGESIPQLKKRISSMFDDMAAYRSERIARTETIRGTNFATEEAYKESGVVEGKEWLATRDERTDEECIQYDGKVIPLGDNYQSKGDNGYEAVPYPPIHVNCRCTLIPVIAHPSA